jgi:SSS family solute:Na+ symporter
MGTLTTLDLIIFFGSLLAVMAVGLWAGREEETSEDFYLAGKQTRWWGVAGSIFGSNVSANHIVGMMGVGFAVGFAPSHFEITAICGLLMLTYVFLPVYRKLNVFTLSEYLSKRYNDASRVSYALIMVIIMVVIQMVPGFYIGSRSLNILLQGDTGRPAVATATVDDEGNVLEIKLSFRGEQYGSAPTVEIATPDGEGELATAEAVVADGAVTAITVTHIGSGYASNKPPGVKLKGGNVSNAAIRPGDVNLTWYRIGIILMAFVTGTYVIFGGLKAVIVTDVIQSVLLLAAGLLVAFVTFGQPEIGGWASMVAMDSAANEGVERLHLYNDMNHPQLPWTGVFSGLMILHFYYWGTNQFIVQRALSARSDREARFGIIFAGFFKLLIPFFSIGTGVAAYYLFRERNMDVSQDAVFITLLAELIAPIGFGLVGLVAAGMIGAILSSLDSMMNSAATIYTFDIYKQYINPEANGKKLISVGRICIGIFIFGAAILTMFTSNPNSDDSFFLTVAKHQGFLVTGVVVAFLLGMFWKRASALGAACSIIFGVVFCYTLPYIYAKTLGTNPDIAALFGKNINFFHTAFVSGVLCTLIHIVISLRVKVDEDKAQYTWVGLGIFTPEQLKKGLIGIGVTLAIYAVLGGLLVKGILGNTGAAWAAAAWTVAIFTKMALVSVQRQIASGETVACAKTYLLEDRFWAGLLAACAIFMMYYFY